MGKHSHGKAYAVIGALVGVLLFSFLASWLIYGDLTSLWVNILNALGASL